jgi:hypothetical protein
LGCSTEQDDWAAALRRMVWLAALRRMVGYGLAALSRMNGIANLPEISATYIQYCEEKIPNLNSFVNKRFPRSKGIINLVIH